MGKVIVNNKESIEKLQKGVNALANAVGSTLGPKGRNVIIPKEGFTPYVTKDGVTVAKSISFKDQCENAGAQLVKDVASKANDEAGDGTTTATILAQSIFNNGVKHLVAGANPIFLKRGIDDAVKNVVDMISAIAKPIGEDYEKVRSIATISANNDAEIGNIITQAMQKVGKNGLVTVEAGSNNGEINIKFTEGMEIDKGYLNGLFITDTEKLTATYQNPFILIVDDIINSSKDLLDIMTYVIRDQNKPLVIVAHDITSEALNMLMLNRLKSNVPVLAIKAQGYGESRTEQLEDLAVLTGGVVINPKVNKLSQFDPEWLGSCSKVESTKDNTIFVEGAGTKSAIECRVEYLKTLINSTEDLWDKEQLQKRLAKLSGGAAVIEVNALSEVEMKEKKDRVDDALSATRAAIAEGIVPGGGSTFARIGYSLRGFAEENYEGEMLLGFKIVLEALNQPIFRICENSGVSGEVILEKTLHNAEGFGYNALTDRFEDLMKNGVIDPAKVLRVALQNASSVASTMLTTSCIIIDDDEKEGQAQVPMI